MNLKADKISFWLIIYDHDPDQAQIFTCPDKAYADVMGSVRSYAFPQDDTTNCPELVAIIDCLGVELRKRWHKNYLPIRFHNLNIDLQRIDVDHTHDLHSLLVDIHQVLAENPDPAVHKLCASVRKLFSQTEFFQ